jgi:phenylacetate-CoA ligase
VFPTQIEELLLGVEGFAPHFECVLTRPNRLDELTVRVERRAGHLDGTAGEHAAARLRDRIKDRVGVTVAVEVVDPGGLTRSVGKARRVIDNRPR